MNRVGSFGRWIWLWATCYVVLMVLVVWSLFAARQWALAELATPEAVGNWEAWREDVRQQQEKDSPVRRRVPKSAEPPALVMLRNYFGVSFGGAVLFSSVLFWVIAWLVNGAARGGQEAASRQ